MLICRGPRLDSRASATLAGRYGLARGRRRSYAGARRESSLLRDVAAELTGFHALSRCSRFEDWEALAARQPHTGGRPRRLCDSAPTCDISPKAVPARAKVRTVAPIGSRRYRPAAPRVSNSAGDCGRCDDWRRTCAALPYARRALASGPPRRGDRSWAEVSRVSRSIARKRSRLPWSHERDRLSCLFRLARCGRCDEHRPRRPAAVQ